MISFSAAIVKGAIIEIIISNQAFCKIIFFTITGKQYSVSDSFGFGTGAHWGSGAKEYQQNNNTG